MPIDADHENITRRPSRDDPGFVKLSQQLQLILRCQGPFKRRVWGLDPREKTDLLYRMLGVDDAMDELESVYSQYVPGTCEWIESNLQYRGWLNDRSLQPRVLFISGPPGSGKSVLTSHIVQSLRGRSLSCQFFFFQHDDQRKQSAVSLFRSLALQLANKIEPFRDYLVALAAGSYSLEHNTQDLIWNKLFTDELPRLLPDRDNPMYWIIDGLDICGSGEAFLSGLANPSLSSIPIRVVVTSRVTPTLSRVCNRLGASLQVQVLRLDKDATDAQKAAMRPLVRTKLGALHEHLTDQTVLEGQGNFLEVNRIVRGILRGKSHPLTSPDNVATSQPDTRQYWKEVAADMSAGWTASKRAHAKRILTLVAYARYPLTIAQVCEAITRYEPMAPDRYDPVQLCGALLQVDGRSRLILRHRTAHEYLVAAEGRDLCCESHEAHGIILAMSLKAMARMSVGGTDSQPRLSLPPDSWASYATTSWEFHLSRGAVYLDGELLSIVDSFLEAPTVVWWIFILASSNQLDLLTDASAALTVLHARRSAMPSLRHNVDHKLLQWATEMAMVHGKFGMHLSRFPRAIYDVVPAFCPETSPIRTLHTSRDEASRLVVKGIPDKAWVETLAKIPVKNPSGIACTSQYVALSSFGSRRVRLVSTTNPCSAKTVHHQESVSRMRFSNSGHMLALASLRTISVWQIDIWVLRWTFAAPPAAPMVDMAFDSGDTALLAYFKDGHVWRYPLEDFAAGSCCLGPALAVGPDGRRHVPKAAAFNQGATMLATAYYDLPLSVWDVSSSGLRGPRPQSNAARQDADRAPDPVDRIDWTPAPCHVLTIRGGSAYAWDPDRQVERQICGGRPKYISSSAGGDFLITIHEVDGDCFSSAIPRVTLWV
ncbi:uncharacterized protein ColSpa_10348 [Colletotrichum spaethianum]|uniref:NACHT domain-containing protein n=1 Tax=Colletotrichum spaethianum TaxID=700344 RepID=A0AA37PDE5_9PEZI|nr:uncharacterized protein ColSpa_10348 [Colletotrichum spaethianum]GKT50167.1 hypothetical protein ColSpa_10348 [Colletotrichum spaethianum]